MLYFIAWKYADFTLQQLPSKAYVSSICTQSQQFQSFNSKISTFLFRKSADQTKIKTEKQQFSRHTSSQNTTHYMNKSHVTEWRKNKKKRRRKPYDSKSFKNFHMVFGMLRCCFGCRNTGSYFYNTASYIFVYRYRTEFLCYFAKSQPWSAYIYIYIT